MKPTFHRLALAGVEPLTSDAWALTFAVPDDLREAYTWQAGQHVVLRDHEGTRRSFSVSAPPSSGVLRIGVKRLPGGAFSDRVVPTLKAGDELDVMTPAGRFVAVIDPARRRRHVAIAAGSGITPVLAIISEVLAAEPESEVVLIFANRNTRSVMFLDEVHDLKDRYRERFSVLHVFSREPRDAELLSGRLDTQRVQRLLDAFAPGQVDEWYLCGPQSMIDELRSGLADQAGAVHSELFHAESSSSAGVIAQRPSVPDGDSATVSVKLSGQTDQFTLDPSGPSILAAALEVRGDLPYACRGGVCGTCRARVTQGSVQMEANYALEPDEVERGYVLTCQSHPTSAEVVVDFDA